MADKPNLVHVEIFGQTYAVKAGADPGYVEALAAFVDGQMKDVSRSSGAVDSLRIAVLAALNLADEVFRLRREVEEAQARPRGRRPVRRARRPARDPARLGARGVSPCRAHRCDSPDWACPARGRRYHPLRGSLRCP